MLNISPLFPIFDRANHGRADSKLFGKIFSRDSGSKRRADGCDGVVWNFGPVVIFTNNMLAPLNRVMSVCAFIANPQMVGVHAQRGVA